MASNPAARSYIGRMDSRDLDADETRARYVAALRAADNHEIEPLRSRS